MIALAYPQYLWDMSRKTIANAMMIDAPTRAAHWLTRRMCDGQGVIVALSVIGIPVAHVWIVAFMRFTQKVGAQSFHVLYSIPAYVLPIVKLIRHIGARLFHCSRCTLWDVCTIAYAREDGVLAQTSDRLTQEIRDGRVIIDARSVTDTPIINEKLPSQMARYRPPQVRIVIAGLMGSGKSTLCRMLVEILGGTWINQDEFAHRKNAKRDFLREIERATNDPDIRIIFVDKINTMYQHRREICNAFAHNPVPGITMLLRMQHPSDSVSGSSHAIGLCEKRIRGRKDGHRTLSGDDPKLLQILHETVGKSEPVSDNERFYKIFSIDMTLPPIALAEQALRYLSDAHVLFDFDTTALSGGQLQEALRIAKQAETDLRTQAYP